MDRFGLGRFGSWAVLVVSRCPTNPAATLQAVHKNTTVQNFLKVRKMV